MHKKNFLVFFLRPLQQIKPTWVGFDIFDFSIDNCYLSFFGVFEPNSKYDFSSLRHFKFYALIA